MQGRSGAVSVIAVAEKGALFDPGPCMYMEKLAVGQAVNPHMVSLLYPIERNLKVVCSRSSNIQSQTASQSGTTCALCDMVA